MNSDSEKTLSRYLGSEPRPGEGSGELGPYRLLDRLGEGGMGEVWLAEQSEPVKRKVALKLIKLGMDTKEVVARFEIERQALAMMDHPCIAKVYDAGATPTGSPYFVMEYIKGVPITEHCNRQRLSVRDRLELFLQVCGGVQHAHHKAVIHRDLKPSNVLVSILDDRPVSKIIDFGVAKAIGHKLTDKTVHTQLGVAIGTPSYMSPEQAEMTGQGIDTRTDVYSLGVLLYELLVGTLPLDLSDGQTTGLESTLRRIREQEPQRPSTRITTLGKHSMQSARARRAELSDLQRELSGDLDWITLKALEKDRSRRYDSPKELAQDIERYLADQPVLASPPSTVYQMKKFARRHTWGVAAGAVSLLVLFGFAVTMSVQARRIAAERDRANLEAATAQQVSGFLKELFQVSDPSEALGNAITAREILDRGAERIEQELADQPLVQARLMHSMGTVYTGLGLYDQAAPFLEQAVDILERELGSEHLEVVVSLNELGDLYRRQGRYSESERLLLRSLTIQENLVGPDHPDVAQRLNDLAILHLTQGQYAEAEPLLERAIAIREKALGPDHPAVADSLNNLAALHWYTGSYAEAESLYRRDLAISEKSLGPDHPGVAATLNNLAILHSTQGRYAEAELLCLRALAIREKVLPSDHPMVGITLQNLALNKWKQGKPTEAESLYLRAIAIIEKAVGPDHPDVALNLSELAHVYDELGRSAEAERLFQRAAQIHAQTLAPDHPDVAWPLHGLANVRRDQDRLAEAEALYEQALTIREKVGAEHPNVAWTLNDLAQLYSEQGKTSEAERAYQRALSIREEALGGDHPEVAETLEDYAALLRQMGRAEEAEPMEARIQSIRTSR